VGALRLRDSVSGCVGAPKIRDNVSGYVGALKVRGSVGGCVGALFLEREKQVGLHLFFNSGCVSALYYRDCKWLCGRT